MTKQERESTLNSWFRRPIIGRVTALAILVTLPASIFIIALIVLVFSGGAKLIVRRLWEVVMADEKEGSPQNPNNGGGYGQNCPPQGAPRNQQQQQPNQYAQQSGGTAAPQHGAPQGFDDYEDQIPF